VFGHLDSAFALVERDVDDAIAERFDVVARGGIGDRSRDRPGGDGRHFSGAEKADERLEAPAVLVDVAFDVLQLGDRIDEEALGVDILDDLLDLLGEAL